MGRKGQQNKKKSMICNDYDKNGIKMFDIYSSLSAFKITWIQRILINSNKTLLSTTLFPELKHFTIFGNSYPSYTLNKIKITPFGMMLSGISEHSLF